MADANMDDFYRRVDRIRKTNHSGGGFEATGAIGRSSYKSRPRQRIPVFGPIAMILMVFIGLKGVIHAQVGAATYDQRVELLKKGTVGERLGAFVLQADGVTLFVSHHILDLVRHP